MVNVSLHGIVKIEMLFKTLWESREARILGDELKGVEPEAIDTFVCPIFHDVKYFCPDFGIFPIQIRLFSRKIMQVVGVSCRVVGPGITINIKKTIAIRRFSPLGVPPMVIISVRISPGTTAL